MTASAEHRYPAGSSAGAGAPAGAAGADAPGAGTRDLRVPDFFLVGHERSGTTALYDMLRAHPQIFMPNLKEPRFFVPELRPHAPRRTGPAVMPRTLEDYLALFAPASPEQRVGEASPQYLRSHTAASRIAELQPAARIIAILREPTSLLRSFHLNAVGTELETERDLGKAIALEGLRREGKQIPRASRSTSGAWLMYSDLVRYAEQLRRYHAVFPPQQVLVLIYDDFRHDNEATVRRVLRFLEVDDTSPIPERKPQGRPKAVRSRLLHRITRAVRIANHNPSVTGPFARTANALIPRRLRNDGFEELWRRIVYSAPPPPDAELVRELRRRFKPDVEAVSEYLGRDLVRLWGYDTIE
jgi:Sulfotransferase family